MRNKDLALDLIVEEDDYGYERYQELSNKENNIYFCVCNLNECPEDAIIGRDLFDAGNYVDALNKGIELAKKGYDYVYMREIKEEN